MLKGFDKILDGPVDTSKCCLLVANFHTYCRETSSCAIHSHILWPFRSRPNKEDKLSLCVLVQCFGPENSCTNFRPEVQWHQQNLNVTKKIPKKKADKICTGVLKQTDKRVGKVNTTLFARTRTITVISGTRKGVRRFIKTCNYRVDDAKVALRVQINWWPKSRRAKRPAQSWPPGVLFLVDLMNFLE